MTRNRQITPQFFLSVRVKYNTKSGTKGEFTIPAEIVQEELQRTYLGALSAPYIDRINDLIRAYAPSEVAEPLAGWSFSQ